MLEETNGDAIMNKTAPAIVAGAALTAAAVLVATRRGGAAPSPAPQHAAGRWRVVTVGLPESEVLVGRALPAPLQELADLVEVRTTPAPGGRGTELSARPRPGT
ncbi:MAG: hypothetical protein Q7T71_14635, partial [Herbiconiux sp.]|nr:hypothetical protein [Herbiconiux sp.]